ncbi:multidrug ABC transporter permease [Vibrio nigripulchritudo]|uniref:ABC transporter ATP-binding protein n=1 Tax=Vibrio nigripulchritudo TaxID=28173 RepID=UPI00190DE235|nr:ABC transporter ATP-binding protein [Vibrio nigripulchritudo]BCL73057.1 multidrug ABC transporter permease [Vibrio nigripulchritudo]BDU34421.1 multidrug ABC transporter permease [Vibrio nigripulchritudo]
MNQEALTSLRWLFQVSAEHKIKLVLSMILSAASALCALAPFYFAYLVLEQLLSDQFDATRVWNWVGLAVLFMIGRYLMLLGAVMLSHKSAFAIQYRIRALALGHMAKLPMGFFSRKSSGEIKKILSEDVDRVELFVAHHISDLVTSIITPLAVFVFLLFIDVRMALAALIPIPLAIFSQMSMYKGFEEKSRHYHESLENLNVSVTEYLRAMPVIRAFNAGGKPHKLFTTSLDSYHKLVVSWIQDAGWPFAAFKTLLDSGLVVLLPIGVYYWSQGSLDVASFTLCILLGVGMMEPLYNLTMLTGHLSQIFEGVTRLQFLMKQEPLSEPAKSETVSNFGVEFDQVGFRYSEESNLVLNDVSFKLEPGTMTAVVGPSGSGKSTLAMLVARFWDTHDGEIRIGGQPIRSLSPGYLMENTAYVFQDSIILSQSVHDNITMGSAASDQDVINAAKAAQAHDFIMALPHGYQTMLGETTNLSGGEKQRIAIARAMLKNAPILILDEATAYADANNQALIQEALASLMKDKTVIVIAHRLSTIVDADSILVLNKGSLVGQGTHHELLAQCSVYRTMWHSHQASREWNLSTKEEELIDA